MNLQFLDDSIPGTILKRTEMDGLTGLEFLKRVFYVSDGVMLTQIRKIAGIDSSTLQNWTKRGWVANSTLKRYNMDQVAHILIINMLRSCMQLEQIAFIIRYINGDLEDTSDDIITDSALYDDICRILSRMTKTDSCTLSEIRTVITDELENYREPMAGAKERLTSALEIIVTTYYATLLKHHADELLQGISNE